MAGFKTHIATSTLLGAGYGAAGYFFFDMPLSSSMLAAGLCSVAGMLPDLDSDNSVPVREMTAFCAAVIPMLMLDRFRQMQFTPESMALAAALIYLVIRFGVVEIFKRYTKHRGMWHSIPAAATVGLLTFLICASMEMDQRIFKSLAVVLGFMSHLVLDEIWSVQFRGVRIGLKRSFGTAVKFWGPSLWGNVSTYAKLIVLIALAVGDPILMEQLDQRARQVQHVARDAAQQINAAVR